MQNIVTLVEKLRKSFFQVLRKMQKISVHVTTALQVICESTIIERLNGFIAYNMHYYD